MNDQFANYSNKNAVFCLEIDSLKIQ